MWYTTDLGHVHLALGYCLCQHGVHVAALAVVALLEQLTSCQIGRGVLLVFIGSIPNVLFCTVFRHGRSAIWDLFRFDVARRFYPSWNDTRTAFPGQRIGLVLECHLHIFSLQRPRLALIVGLPHTLIFGPGFDPFISIVNENFVTFLYVLCRFNLENNHVALEILHLFDSMVPSSLVMVHGVVLRPLKLCIGFALVIDKIDEWRHGQKQKGRFGVTVSIVDGNLLATGSCLVINIGWFSLLIWSYNNVIHIHQLFLPKQNCGNDRDGFACGNVLAGKSSVTSLGDGGLGGVHDVDTNGILLQPLLFLQNVFVSVQVSATSFFDSFELFVVFRNEGFDSGSTFASSRSENLVQHKVQHVFFQLIAHFSFKAVIKVNDAVENLVSLRKVLSIDFVLEGSGFVLVPHVTKVWEKFHPGWYGLCGFHGHIVDTGNRTTAQVWDTRLSNVFSLAEQRRRQLPVNIRDESVVIPQCSHPREIRRCGHISFKLGGRKVGSPHLILKVVQHSFVVLAILVGLDKKINKWNA
mmetsp:Transcript_21750/g.60447  ORF Transcript_21750/g.60447 Transcript_21750/m.60447 type:complete len:524 (-) Transcript_21750:244-1815(-)